MYVLFFEKGAGRQAGHQQACQGPSQDTRLIKVKSMQPVEQKKEGCIK